MEGQPPADERCLKKLNLNIPLLSIRRQGHEPFGSESRFLAKDTSERVPFSWEQSPGKPKLAIVERNEMYWSSATEPVRPKPPPCRYHSSENVIAEDTEDDGDGYLIHDHDDHLNGRVSMNVDEDERDCLSDAIDVASLSEAIDCLERTDHKARNRLSASRLKMVDSAQAPSSPSFMINRFLPDANAVAAFFSNRTRNHTRSFSRARRRSSDWWSSPNVSGFSLGGDEESRLSSATATATATVTPTTTTTATVKGCGLENIFSWRTKHKLCGVKSPVLRPPPSHAQPH